jgi:hypothetical protein
MKIRLMTGIVLLSSGMALAKCDTPVLKTQDNTIAALPQQPIIKNASDNTHIKVALLLDTSNSMDGLIEQAKSRLWNIINAITTLKYQGKEPVIEIALYEYGNDGLSQQSNYIRQVAPLTTDLDLISEKLFALRTNGGNEYCGAVISEAVKKLSWGDGNTDMKLIYIAGNEEFSQGGINYKESVADALHHSIYVNTIFCGNKMEGINTNWKDGADRGGGKYFNIDANKQVTFIETPYDAQIEACDIRINKTYISYGSQGRAKKSNQAVQDNNAKSINKSNYTERAVSKSKTAYENSSWDIVDRVKKDKDAVRKIKDEDLPAELKGKSKPEIETIIAEKTKEREVIQKEIAALSVKRQQYIDEQNKKNPGKDDLGEAINRSIRELAVKKGYALQ